ncbi:hypothetical protein D5018_14110 [Parashewanella curva]|uniref:Uncharacterized protein n=1 Tax=Parashewanella curva TaxID=2338552 RepID=A0A3L8PYA1_9GAMM|nr:hypothetical protein [Parashewanella curva]RLV59022.1 hypothetical protein D5018_14110 [Parashewanella curva]
MQVNRLFGLLGMLDLLCCCLPVRSVSETESTHSIGKQTVSEKEKIERQRLLFTPQYQQLIQYAEGHEKLSNKLLTLSEADVTAMDRAIYQRDWNSPELKRADAEHIVILLYLKGQLAPTLFMHVLLIVKNFQQFGCSKIKTECNYSAHLTQSA